ncbi:MAG: DPP IV N-terminal domain-containing protein, partial [Planctomycetota bacterium]|nr:DPP IV N-terminal domain-containing protein [Planctomycetota bacterium]
GDDEGLVRLTRTRTAEREVQYLPDGSGYTSLVDGALVRVRFGDHLVDQLDPELPGGLTMRSYALSPDGKRIVFVASSGSIYRGGSRTVDIATYRDRFMKVRTVPRTVSDDPVAKVESAVFLHELPTGDSEVGRLIKVYERTSSGPRDVLQLPDWAPDSSSVTFSVFDQATSQVHILEADFEKDEPEEDSGSEDTESADEEGAESPADEKAEEDELPGTGELEEREARIVHRFLHTGGPNTPRMIEPRYLADSRRIALITEQTGFRHVHVLDPVYETLVPMTHGRYEVYPLGMNEARTHMFMEATKEDSACLDIYSLEFDSGELARLTERRGVHSSAAVSDDGAHVLAIHAAFGSPRELVHVANAKDTTAIT